MFLGLKCEQQRKQDEQNTLDTHDEQKERVTTIQTNIDSETGPVEEPLPF